MSVLTSQSPPVIGDDFLNGISSITTSRYPDYLSGSQASGGSKVTLFGYRYYGEDTPFRTFDAFDGFLGGARLAARDLDGDGT
ncbi:hypothetical protein U2060_15035, partial [Listeria monocytogenes]